MSKNEEGKNSVDPISLSSTAFAFKLQVVTLLNVSNLLWHLVVLYICVNLTMILNLRESYCKNNQNSFHDTLYPGIKKAKPNRLSATNVDDATDSCFLCSTHKFVTFSLNQTRSNSVVNFRIYWAVQIWNPKISAHVLQYVKR